MIIDYAKIEKDYQPMVDENVRQGVVAHIYERATQKPLTDEAGSPIEVKILSSTAYNSHGRRCVRASIDGKIDELRLEDLGIGNRFSKYMLVRVPSNKPCMPA